MKNNPLPGTPDANSSLVPAEVPSVTQRLKPPLASFPENTARGVAIVLSLLFCGFASFANWASPNGSHEPGRAGAAKTAAAGLSDAVQPAETRFAAVVLTAESAFDQLVKTPPCLLATLDVKDWPCQEFC